MYNLKNTLFLDLTKNQKASLFTFLKSFTKKHADKTVDEIIILFREDETYYYEQGNPHFEWIISEFEKENFTVDVKKYIIECLNQIEIKEAQRPYLEKQKAIAKEQRQKQKEYLLSKQEPTKKQLYYYEKLCKKYNLTKIETEGLSRLDLINMIGKIIDDSAEKQTDKLI